MMKPPPFEHIVGNSQIKTYLSRHPCPQSMLFAGPDGVGKSLFAEAVAEGLLKSKVDLHVYRPEGKIGMHTIASMRKFSEDVYMAPFEGPWKVFIIHDAERMLPYSANALLKTFEEPANDTMIILLSSAPSALLPTILSRCCTLHFQSLKEEEIAQLLQTKWSQSEEKAKRLAALSQGSMGYAVRLLEGGEEIRKEILQLLSAGKMSSWKALEKAAEEINQKIEETKKGIDESMFYQGPRENLTAIQKESLQKEVEGFLAMRLMHEAQALFDVILGWYRDMALLQVNGNRSYLIHRDYESAVEQALQRGQMLPLEQVQHYLAEARLSLERSTTLSTCLETLFLRLNLL